MYVRSKGIKRKYSAKGRKGAKRLRSSVAGVLQPRSFRYLSTRLQGGPGPYGGINRGPSYMPDCYYTKLKFAFSAGWTSTSGLATYAAIRSSVGDPLGSLGSVRPMGASVLDSIWNRWTCLGSRAKLTITQNTAAASTGNTSSHCLVPYGNTSNPFSGTDVIRTSTAPYGKLAICVDAQNSRSIVSYASAAKMWGVTQSRVTDDPNFGGTGTTDPSFYFIWVIGAQTSDVATTASGVYHFEITYYMRYWERKNDPAA